MQAWASLTATSPEPWEVAALRKLDTLYINTIGREEE